MSHLLRYAYLAELFLWVPLAFLVATTPSARRWLAAPLAASILAAGYEAYMTFVWEPKVTAPIRIDIFLVLMAVGVANAICGLGLAVVAAGRPDRGRLRGAAALCLAVPAIGLAGYGFLQTETKELEATFAQGRQFRFEASFRDDATERRVFGDIRSATNPWTGYYVAGDEDDRFRHLVINDAGRFWLYGKALYQSGGAGKPDSSDPERFEGRGTGRMNERMRLALRRQGEGAYLLEVDFGYGAATPPKAVSIRRATPPRFPQAASPGDEVRFLGVFSGTYDEKDRGFWVVQAWLWESKGEVWGRYLHDHYVRGIRREFIHPEEIRVTCAEQCSVLRFDTGRGQRMLQRISPDELQGAYGSPPQEVTLRRGEIVPGFLLDLAPLATANRNREWIKAVMAGQMGEWQVPER